MTSIATVKKYTKKSLIPNLEERGFQCHSGLEFSKKVGDGIYQIISGGISYGENLGFSVTCYVPEYNLKKMEKFPQYVPLTTGGDLGEGFYAGELWDVGKEENIEEVLLSVIEYVDKYAIPWFSKIKSRADYVDNLFPHLKEKLENEGRLHEILKGTK